MRIVKIYGLVNPFNNRKFYIGATEKPLEKRLYQHLCVMNSKRKKGRHLQSRSELYQKCIENCKKIRIVLLEEVLFKNADSAENKWHSVYSRKNTLYQNKISSFINQNIWSNSPIITNRFKSKRKHEHIKPKRGFNNSNGFAATH